MATRTIIVNLYDPVVLVSRKEMKHYFAICDRVIDEKYAMLLKTVNLLISKYKHVHHFYF